MTKQLIIVGASGLGKEVFWLADRLGLVVRGFLDDAFDGPGNEHCGRPVFGPIDDAVDHKDAAFSIAIGNPRTRKSAVERMQGKGIQDFMTLIDPTACVGPTVNIGKGSIICAGSMATYDIDIGPFTLLDRGAMIGHDSTIGAFTTIAPLASLSGNVTVGETVEIGTSAVVRQGLSLGRGSLLGMGAVLVRDLQENEVAAGNPAKTLRFVK